MTRSSRSPSPMLLVLPLMLVLAGLAPSLASAACDPGSPLLGAPVPLATGPNPLYMVASDFDEDGILDLAVTNSDVLAGGFDASVAILRGLGGTSYAAPVLYPVPLNPHMLATGDFNEDGITDLVTADKWSSSISVLLGQGSGGVGDGTFAPAVSYGTGGFPFQLVIEDFDADGIVDIAASINDVGAVALLKGGGSGGVGDGTFVLVASLPLFAPSTGLERGDFNEDGITDLVATENGNGTVALLLGTGSATLGSGSFAPATHHPASPVPFELAVADFNEDGLADLAVTHQVTDGGTSVMLGNGNGTFQAFVLLPTGNSTAVAADDLDQDGITDLVVGAIASGSLSNVMFCRGLGSGGVGSGAFAAPVAYGSDGDAYQLLTGDLDGDGRRDVAASHYLGTGIALLPGTCVSVPPPSDPRFPVLTGVRDVPNDEGGRVFLTWTRSSLDATGGPVNAYRVWRRIAPGLVAEQLLAGELPAGVLARPVDGAHATLLEYWEALATLPAQRLEGYGYTAATTEDATNQSTPYTAFFVTALTSDIDVFFSSNVDSAFSVDNKPPHGPVSFAAQYQGGHVSLQWEESGASDFSEFRLYRGTTPDFQPGEATLVASTTETGYMDTAPPAGLSHYKLSAVDVHGNESEFALASPQATTGVWIQTSLPGFALRQPTPNPGDGRRLEVEFSLAEQAPATLELLDVAGRVIRSHDVGSAGPGAHRLELAGRERLGAGLYFVRLRHRGAEAIARAAVIR